MKRELILIEAWLFGSETPLSVAKLRELFARLGMERSTAEIGLMLTELQQLYQEHGIELCEVASGWHFRVRQSCSNEVALLNAERPQKYSKAFLEVLALIAYRQPITRAEIEEVRGVAVGSNIIRTMLEHGWIKIIGHKEVPGRPALFATTKQFLDHFNLKALDELPTLLQFDELDINDSLENAEDNSVENITHNDVEIDGGARSENDPQIASSNDDAT